MKGRGQQRGRVVVAATTTTTRTGGLSGTNTNISAGGKRRIDATAATSTSTMATSSRFTEGTNSSSDKDSDENGSSTRDNEEVIIEYDAQQEELDQSKHRPARSRSGGNDNDDDDEDSDYDDDEYDDDLLNLMLSVGGGGTGTGTGGDVTGAPAATPNADDDRDADDIDIDGGGNNSSGNKKQQQTIVVQQPYALSIMEDSPAAEALRANANIHVSSVGKAARAVHMQSVRRVMKRATGKRKSGVRKGKPPRVPPGMHINQDEDEIDLNSIVEEESDEEEESSGSELDEEESSYLSEGVEVIVQEEEVAEAVEAAEPFLHPHPHHRHGEEAEVAAAPDDENKLNLSAATTTNLDQHIPQGVAPGTVEAGRKVLRDVDPHGILKLVRWRRTKKGTMKKKKSYVKGKVIDGEHELYTLSIAVMIGVRTSISRTNTELNSGPGRRWVRMSDFRATEKYEFRPKGDGPLPPHQLAHTFKFKDYSPVVFAYLRRMYGVNEFDFLLSVCGNANFIEFISNAKSGQFFFYSSDGRYMIKTMTNAESKFLRRILPRYFRHCCENPNTMITRFFGMYRVKLYHLRRNVKFVIMNSVYYTDKHLQTFYDLKGSSLGRSAKPGQAVLKDNDLRKKLPDEALALRPKERSAVHDQIEADCRFLTEMGIMDYSMLVGVHHRPAFEGKNAMTVSFRRSKAMSRPKKGASHSEHPEDEDTAIETAAAVDLSPPRGSFRSAFHPGSPIRNNNLLKRPSKHKRNKSDGATPAAIQAFESDGLEEDDNSYLLGSPRHPAPTANMDAGMKRKKLVTIEKLFWPFHHMYDIHGHRRMHPVRCPLCGGQPCDCVENDQNLLQGYGIPKFVPPLSDRKDGGFEMDTTGLQLPMKLHTAGGDLFYDGKIFYMGVIDVLQQYTSRKAVESRYRFFRTGSGLSASCVAPLKYGLRFLDFFDQYTRREPRQNTEEEGVEAISERDTKVERERVEF